MTCKKYPLLSEECIIFSPIFCAISREKVLFCSICFALFVLSSSHKKGGGGGHPQMAAPLPRPDRSDQVGVAHEEPVRLPQPPGGRQRWPAPPGWPQDHVPGGKRPSRAGAWPAGPGERSLGSPAKPEGPRSPGPEESPPPPLWGVQHRPRSGLPPPRRRVLIWVEKRWMGPLQSG